MVGGVGEAEGHTGRQADVLSVGRYSQPCWLAGMQARAVVRGGGGG